MVARWDSQQAMKPPAFDQDDYVTSVDGLLDIAVTSRGGRLNSGWKKVCTLLHAVASDRPFVNCFCEAVIWIMLYPCRRCYLHASTFAACTMHHSIYWFSCLWTHHRCTYY